MITRFIDFFFFLLWFFFLFTSVSVADNHPQVSASPASLQIANFTAGELTAWKPLEFSGQTEYQIVTKDGVLLLEAVSRGSASGLIKKIRVDLLEYPFLNWSWQLGRPLDLFEEQRKSGDDFAARIYVIVAAGIFPWNKKAVNYVWSGATPKDQVWPSPYAGKNSMMVAVRSGQDPAGKTYIEKRNIYADLKQLFGKEIRYIDAVALMTDSDDSRGEALAYYGNIYFSGN